MFLETWKSFTFCRIKKVYSNLHLHIVKIACFLPNLVPQILAQNFSVFSYFKLMLNESTQ